MIYKKIHLGIILLVVFAFICVFYFNKTKRIINKKNVGQVIYLNKLFEDVNNLPKITFIKDLFNLPDSINTYSYLFIYCDKGCKGCNIKGEELVKSININKLYILQLSDRESDDYFERKNYIRIHNDVDYYLHKINYIKTPIIIKFDSSYTVQNAFFPGIQNENKFTSFLNNSIENH
jgi:hypothetical protein